jgi:phage terminase large subunit
MEKTIIQIPSEYQPIFSDNWREAAVWGGRYSLKSHTVARFLLIRARERKTRVACFREFQNSISESSHQLLCDIIEKYGMNDFHVTNNSIINNVNGSDFIFKGLWNNDQSIKSIEGIDIAWVEEAQTVSQKSLEVLTPTIRKPGSKIIYTYNRLMEDDPVHTRLVIEGRPDTLLLNVNYDIAVKYGWMPKEILKEIEDDKLNRPALYKHKWLGKPYGLERKIYRDWNVIDEIPHEARLWRRGLDFGYSVDPTVVEDIYEYNGGFIIDERIYQKGLSNKAIADKLLNFENPNVLVIADSAEPKSIDEIRSYGVNIIGAKKGQGSVLQGIQYVQDQKISVTSRSEKTVKAYRNYMFQLDRNGKIVQVPDDTNHEWSNPMDCLVKGTLIKTQKGDVPIEMVTTNDYVYTRQGLKKVKDAWKVRDNADVISLVFSDGSGLIGTPNHRIFANGGWKYLRDIRYGDILETWTKLFTKTGAIIDIQKRVNTTTTMVKTSYIDRYGKIIMEKSQKVFMYIIKTASRLITGLKTLSLYIVDCMGRCTSLNERLFRRSVIVAGLNLSVKQEEKQIGSVQINVNRSGEENKKSTLLSKFVRFVKKSLNRVSLNLRHIAPISVVDVQELKGFTVYDLTVEDQNEYYANGVLVHNSIRYGFNGTQIEDNSEDIFEKAAKARVKKQKTLDCGSFIATEVERKNDYTFL